MATKKVKEAEAMAAAKRYLEIKTSIKELEKELKEKMECVESFVKDTGEMRLGDAQVFERKNPAKLNLLDPKKLQSFMRLIPNDYIKKSLDVKLIADNFEEDEKLKAAMVKFNATIEQTAGLHIKHF